MPVSDVIAIDNMIVNSVIEVLTQKLITDIADVDDPTRGAVIRAGKLQQSPQTGSGINVLMWPEEEDNPNELYTNNNGLESPAYSIGGSAFFMHRFRLYMLFHFVGYQSEQGRIDARTNAYVVLSRIREAIKNMSMPQHPVTGLNRDDFGEVIIANQIDSFWLRESGGSGNYIWKGELAFCFLTETSDIQ